MAGPNADAKRPSTSLLWLIAAGAALAGGAIAWEGHQKRQRLDELERQLTDLEAKFAERENRSIARKLLREVPTPAKDGGELE
ncbi:MAG TPA: hypothetical protein PKC18_21165 [Lacipirellulaceae bacterium]|nr:hypothetical protein [Lacipirellulaceae bacterium]HMP04834.1 hypothetical protein [Lacipirellulaceae bacterium]